MLMRKCILFLCIGFFLGADTFSQDSIKSDINVNHLKKFLNQTRQKVSKYGEKITHETNKVIEELRKEEIRILRKKFKSDTTTLNNYLHECKARYEDIAYKLSQPDISNYTTSLSGYVPFLDSIRTSVAFLNADFITDKLVTTEIKKNLKAVSEKLDDLRDNFKKVSLAQDFIRERKQLLINKFDGVADLKDLRKISKKVFYFSQRVKDIKEAFSNANKIEKYAIDWLKKIPAFVNFFQSNSMLGSIFGSASIGGAPVSRPASFVGIQTRTGVQQIVSAAISTTSVNSSQFVNQQLESANNQLSSLKNKLAFTDLSGNPESMPDFKINPEKTKPLLKRLELGGNVQFSKVNSLLPGTGDFAISLGYKLSDKGTIGIGSTYKLGFGTLKRISFSHQGFGFRSFIDLKLKGNFFISGGYERNYLNKLPNVLNNLPLSKWQESGLLGVLRKIAVNKKRKLTFQLLYDLLYKRNTPVSQPVVFRTGWIF